MFFQEKLLEEVMSAIGTVKETYLDYNVQFDLPVVRQRTEKCSNRRTDVRRVYVGRFFKTGCPTDEQSDDYRDQASDHAIPKITDSVQPQCLPENRRVLSKIVIFDLVIF